MITLCCHAVTPTLNQLLRLHWRDRLRCRNEWRALVFAAIATHGAVPLATGPRAVTVLRIGKRAVDTDGLYGGTKPLLDALVHHRLLLDDSPSACHLEVTQRRTERGEMPHTVVTLDDLE